MLRQRSANRIPPAGAEAVSAFRAGCLLLALSAVARATIAATTIPVEIHPQAITLVRVSKLEPDVPDGELATSGLIVRLALRAAEGQRIRRLGNVEISRAVDDTGCTIPAVEGTTQFVTVTTLGNGTVLQSFSRSVSVEAESTQPKQRTLFGFQSPSRPAKRPPVGTPERTGFTTATLRVFLGLPSPQARVVRNLEGTVEVELGEATVFTFRDLPSRIRKPLDLGTSEAVTLEVTRAEGGKVALAASGPTSRLGRLAFFDRNGNRLSALSSSRSESTTNGVGRMETEYDFGDVDGPIDLAVPVYRTVHTVKTPFAFQNIALP